MFRAVAKAAVQGAFGRVSGGPRLYRELTRKHLGTAASHVSKLDRVWPEYAGTWSAIGGIRLEGARIWMHEVGPTAYSSLAAFVSTGNAGVVTNSSERILTRTLARSVNALALAGQRGASLEALRWHQDAQEAIASLGGEVHVGVCPQRLPLATESVDIGHSGGVLEHYELSELRDFLSESFRVLRPGGLMSHVLDHRDHLYHADKGIPFLAHLRQSDSSYRLLFGHALGFHNRLSPSQVCACFEAAGFERVALRRLILPAHHYVSGDEEATKLGTPGLQRQQLAPQFRALSDADLCTAAAHYLYRKPTVVISP